MSGKKTILLPGPEKILKDLGVNLKLARKRRKLSRNLVAERAGIARSTLQLIEDGNPGVAMSSYLQVLFVLGLEKDLLRVAADDLVGRKLQDAALLNKRKGRDDNNSGLASTRFYEDHPVPDNGEMEMLIKFATQVR
jgi:transcriptional regulator with XRE-family HTH domain